MHIYWGKRVKISWMGFVLLLSYATFRLHQPIYAQQPAYPYETILKLDAGKNHAGLLTSQGQLFMWGEGAYGRLGTGLTKNELLPVNITRLSNDFSTFGTERIQDFSLGAEHSAALTSSGRLFTWGAGAEGRLGNGTTVNLNNPFEITNRFPANDKIIAIAMGGQHSSAITESGRLYMWGKGDYGRLGNGNTANQLTPVDITNLPSSPLYQIFLQDKIVKVRLGSEFSGALTQSGRLFLWGRGHVGQLGNNNTLSQIFPVDITNRFTQLLGGEKIIEFALGREHGIALTSLGKVFAWGGNTDGRVGNGTSTNVPTPVNITTQGDFSLLGTDKIVKVQAGLLHTAALSEQGKVFVWGESNNGRLGLGSTPNQLRPKQLNGFGALSSLIEPIKHFALGWQHSLVSTEQADVFTFGNHTLGQLGLGSNTTAMNLTVPNRISTLGDLLTVFNFNQATIVMNAIAALPSQPRIADQGRITEVHLAYQKLNQTQKNLVTNYGSLQAILQTINQLIEGYQRVRELIQLLPASIDIPDKAKIDEARQAYDQLTEEQKGYVDITQLIRAENDYQLRLQEIQSVIALISLIPEVITLAEETQIQSVRQLYNQLTDAQKALVTNINTLLQAETSMQALYIAIDEVMTIINALPSLNTITLANEQAVIEARAKYETLDSLQQERVTNLALLEALETKILNLKAEIEAVKQLINQIPEPDTITVEDEAIIQASRQAYNVLHPTQQVLINNYDWLLAAEVKLNTLLNEINQVALLISGLPSTITLVHRQVVSDVRTAFNQLSSTQQVRVDNFDTLVAAETRIRYWEQVRDDFIAKVNAFSENDQRFSTYLEVQNLLNQAQTFDEVLRLEIQSAYEKLVDIENLLRGVNRLNIVLTNPWFWISVMLVILMLVWLTVKRWKRKDNLFKHKTFHLGQLQ